MKKFLKSLWHPIEGGLVFLSYCIFYILPADKSSFFGGWLARKLIPISGAAKTAHRNLKTAFPQNSDQTNSEIIKNVCDNFGRDIAEYVHLQFMNVYDNPRFEIVGTEIIDQLKNDGKPGIIYGAHLASWEVAIMALNQRGLKTTQLYRALNNPYADKIIRRVQRNIGSEVLTKGSGDAKKVLDVIKRGDHLFILVDQKMNEGIPVPFFGRDAMTAPAAVRLAMKYNCPLVPARVERLEGGFKFKITFYPPQKLIDTGNFFEDLNSNLSVMNKTIEEWVRERPDQWLWIHNRWP